MKIGFVALVVFAGYSSGVIVPTIVSKLASNKTTPTSKASELEKYNKSDLETSNQIDEKELFQTATDKKNSLNERSFIFINQRYKTPLISQLYNSQTHNLNEPFPIRKVLSQVDAIPPCFEKVNPRKDLFVPNIKRKSSVQTKYSPPKFRNMERKILTSYKDDKYILQKMQESIQTKPPFIIPFSQNSEDSLYKKIKNFNSENTMKPYQSDKIQPMSSYARHRINYNYGFPSAARSFHESANNGLSYQPEDITIKATLITDSTADVSPLDFNDEDDNVLERYIKEALEKSYVNDIADIHVLKKCKNCKSKTQTDNNCECPDEKLSVNPASSEYDRLFVSNDDKQWILNQ